MSSLRVSAPSGGVLSALDTVMYIARCRFSAISSANQGAVVLVNSTVSCNSPACANLLSLLHVVDSTFDGNQVWHPLRGGRRHYSSSRDASGALDFRAPLVCLLPQMTGVHGSILDSLDSTVSIQNCNFTSNIGAYGGALHVADGVSATLSQSTFLNNSALYGGG